MLTSRFVAALAATLLILDPVGAWAQEPVEMVEVDFSADRGPPPGWSADPGDPGVWMLEGDSLYGSGHAWYRYTAHEWDDLDVAFSMQLNGGLHVNLREGAQGRYRLGIRTSDGETFLSIARGNDVVAELPPFEAAEILAVQTSVTGGEVALTVDGRTLSWIDRNPLPPGTFGFESLEFTDPVFIDWVRLAGTRTAPPTTAVTPPPPGETPGAQGLPDLVVEGLEAQVGDDGSLDVRGVVVNVGGRPAPATTVTLAAGRATLAELPIPSLETGRSHGFGEIVSPVVGAGGSIELSVTVDPAGRIEELAEGNNRASVGITLGVAPEGTPPWPILIGTGAVIVIAGTSVLMRRRLVRRRWERSATDEAKRGRCTADDEYTKRDCSKSLKPRKLVSVAATALDAARTRGALCDLSEVLPPLRRALRCDRLMDEEGCAAALDTAAAALAGAVGDWIAELETAHHVVLSAAYEGSSADATFTRLRCGPDGQWPDPASAPSRQIRGRWKGSVSDKAVIELGRVDNVRNLSRPAVEAEARELLERLIQTVSECRHPFPRGFEVEVKAEV